MADPQVRLPKVTKVKNKQPASRQITAEQILREAKEIQLEDDYQVRGTGAGGAQACRGAAMPGRMQRDALALLAADGAPPPPCARLHLPQAPKTIITDPEELAEYRLRKRKEFEDTVRRVGRWQPSIWVKVRAIRAAQRVAAVAGVGRPTGRTCAREERDSEALLPPGGRAWHRQLAGGELLVAAARPCLPTCGHTHTMPRTPTVRHMGGAAEGLPPCAQRVGARPGQ